VRAKHSRRKAAAKTTLASEIQRTIIMESFDYYPALSRLYSHVKDKPNASLSLEDAASIAGMERTHFCKFFRSKTGVTFKHWFDYMRIQFAISLFQRSDESVTEVASKSGFDELATFERTFRRVRGMNPKKFKEQHCRPEMITPKVREKPL